MKSHRRLSLVLILGVAGSFAFGLLRGGTTLATYEWGPDAPSPESWTYQGRQMREAQWSLVGNLTAGAGKESTASVLRQGPGGTLLTLDYRTSELWQVDPDTGAAEARVQASAPILDFGVDRAGEIWWLEDGHRELQGLRGPGSAATFRPFEEVPLRAAVGTGDEIVTAHGEFHPHLFRSYSKQGSPGAAFGKFLEGKIQDSMILEGDLAEIPHRGFVYVPHYLPFLAAFAYDGERLFHRPLVATAASPPPKVVRGPRESRNLQPGTPVRSLSVQVVGGRIAVLAEASSSQGHGRILDLYRGTDGKYQGSLPLPKGTRAALLLGNELFTLHRDGIRRWQAEPPTVLTEVFGG